MPHFRIYFQDSQRHCIRLENMGELKKWEMLLGHSSCIVQINWLFYSL
jgi:hypothetical protein